MIKWLAIITLTLLFVIVGAGCGGAPTAAPGGTVPQPPAASEEQPIPAPAKQATFEPITITGSGDKTSPPFMVTTNEWVIDWSYVPNLEYPKMAVFGFFVYPRGKTAGSVASASFADEKGTTYCYADAGEYYVDVIAANIESWTITISPPNKGG
jgi:hypothetical protein